MAPQIHSTLRFCRSPLHFESLVDRLCGRQTFRLPHGLSLGRADRMSAAHETCLFTSPVLGTERSGLASRGKINYTARS